MYGNMSSLPLCVRSTTAYKIMGAEGVVCNGRQRQARQSSPPEVTGSHRRTKIGRTSGNASPVCRNKWKRTDGLYLRSNEEIARQFEENLPLHRERTGSSQRYFYLFPLRTSSGHSYIICTLRRLLSPAVIGLSKKWLLHCRCRIPPSSDSGTHRSRYPNRIEKRTRFPGCNRPYRRRTFLLTARGIKKPGAVTTTDHLPENSIPRNTASCSKRCCKGERSWKKEKDWMS